MGNKNKIKEAEIWIQKSYNTYKYIQKIILQIYIAITNHIKVLFFLSILFLNLQEFVQMKMINQTGPF